VQTHKITERKGVNYLLDNGKQYRANALQKVTKEEVEQKPDVVKAAKVQKKKDDYYKREDIREENIVPEQPEEVRKSTRSKMPTEKALENIAGRGRMIFPF